MTLRPLLAFACPVAYLSALNRSRLAGIHLMNTAGNWTVRLGHGRHSVTAPTLRRAVYLAARKHEKRVLCRLPVAPGGAP
jgi:hypothetical protein